MKTDHTPHPLEGLIADYLNGHLSESDLHAFTSALAEDPQLQNLVEFERNIQMSILAEQDAPSSVPQFSSIADRLDGPENTSSLVDSTWNILSSRWTTWAPSVAIAVLVAVVVAYFPHSQTINEFETLSDSPSTVNQPLLRMINNDDLDDTALNKLLDEYDLMIVKRYADANAVDVIPKNNERLETLAKMLENDKRIKYVQIKRSH